MVNPAGASTLDPALRSILPERAKRACRGPLRGNGFGRAIASIAGPLAGQRSRTLDGGTEVRPSVFRWNANPEEGAQPGTPLGVVGAFLNGVPLYTPVSAQSPTAARTCGIATASASRNSERPICAARSLLTHSGYAPFTTDRICLDGYPVYGPFGWDQDGTVRRFRSSYRLRAITLRTLASRRYRAQPSQEGPPVSLDSPLGTFSRITNMSRLRRSRRI